MGQRRGLALHRLTGAAPAPQLEVLKWASRSGCDTGGAYTLSKAARAGQLAVLEWAAAQGWAWNAFTMEQAARGGHLPLVQWLWARRCPHNR